MTESKTNMYYLMVIEKKDFEKKCIWILIEKMLHVYRHEFSNIAHDV